MARPWLWSVCRERGTVFKSSPFLVLASCRVLKVLWLLKQQSNSEVEQKQKQGRKEKERAQWLQQLLLVSPKPPGPLPPPPTASNLAPAVLVLSLKSKKLAGNVCVACCLDPGTFGFSEGAVGLYL